MISDTAAGARLRDLSIWHALSANGSTHAQRMAFFSDDGNLTHAVFRDKCLDAASDLHAAGLAAGDRVAFLAENSVECFVLIGASARLGAIAVPLNWRLTASELAGILADCRPSMLFADEATRPAAEEALRECGLKLELRLLATLGDSDAVGRLQAPLPPEPGSLNALLLIYTAAVAGKPRGATISHGNLLAASVQLSLGVDFGPDDIFLANLPLFHIMGAGFSLSVQLAGGANVVRPRFDAADAAEAIERHAVTTIGTFPPMLATLLDAAETGSRNLASLRAAIGLDAPGTIERLERLWPNARFWTGFGQTETSGLVTIGRATDMPGASGAPGRLSAIGIVDEAGNARQPGEVGQIVVRGPTVMLGYWDDPDDEGGAFAGGWHHTGDLGSVGDDGLLRFAGPAPAKLLIKTGGENVYPAEVERVLLEHPSVREAAVFGIPDERWGEAVAAAIVCETENPITTDALSDHVASRIARYKRPTRWLVLEQIPRDINGLFDVNALRVNIRDAVQG